MDPKLVLKGAAFAAALASVFIISGCSVGVHESKSAAVVDGSICDGIPPEVQAKGLVAEIQSVDYVGPVSEAANPKALARLAGAEIYVRSPQATTAQWLNRVAQCHMYLHATESAPLGDETTCPFAVAGASTEINPTDNGFVIVVRSSHNSAASEILAKSLSLRNETRNLALLRPAR